LIGDGQDGGRGGQAPRLTASALAAGGSLCFTPRHPTTVHIAGPWQLQQDRKQ
jgi:hypothetical protein